MINAVIVEDSELARLELKNLLQAFDEIRIIAEADDADSAVATILKLAPDLVFMDIDLHGGNAFEVLEQLEVVPPIIFTTAFDQFALTAFEFNTVDYLLKPIKKERLHKAIRKLDLNASEPSSDEEARELTVDSQFFIKDGEHCWLAKIKDVRYLEAVGNYSRVFFLDHSPLHYSSLQKIGTRLGQKQFFRINRQQIVNLNHVSSIEPWVTGGLRVTLSCGTTLDVSRRQANHFKQLMSL